LNDSCTNRNPALPTKSRAEAADLIFARRT
jgi:hypothetical protein